MTDERPIVFSCAGDRLTGILHMGNTTDAEIGVIIVVGGPQYRVGSHRQFVLMARRFAGRGVPVLRFDVRGMGDSEGDFRSFEELDDDIRAAIDAFMVKLPTLSKIVLLGLCDAASANLMYGKSDPRIHGLILLNPWVRTAQGEAQAYLRHYYRQRLFQRSFWRKVVSGEVLPARSIWEFLDSLKIARGGKRLSGREPVPFLQRMLAGWERFQHPVLLCISGRDLTASEFMDLCRANDRWGALLQNPQCQTIEFQESDHTMSNKESLHSMTDCCLEWIGTFKKN